MTPMQYMDWMALFFSQCMAITAKKNNDYSPDSVVLGEVVQTAFELGINVPQALAVHLRKHWSALVTHFQGQKLLSSETIDDRLHDAINYLVFLSFWEQYRANTVQAMYEVVSERKCECDMHYVFEPGHDGQELVGVELKVEACDRCKFIHHLVTLNM
jgi:hypothetical protein